VLGFPWRSARSNLLGGANSAEALQCQKMCMKPAIWKPFDASVPVNRIAFLPVRVPMSAWLQTENVVRHVSATRTLRHLAAEETFIGESIQKAKKDRLRKAADSLYSATLFIVMVFSIDMWAGTVYSLPSLPTLHTCTTLPPFRTYLTPDHTILSVIKVMTA